MTSKMRRLVVLTGLTDTHIAHIAAELAEPPHAGRPWALSLASRVVLAAAALRTNLTVRQLAAVFDVSKSQAHRIINDLTPRLAGLLDGTVDDDRRWSWTVDGTLIPTRDRAAAGKSKNYRYSTNAQVLSRRSDLLVIAVHGGGPGNRNDTVHYRDTSVQQRGVSTAASTPTAATAASPNSTRLGSPETGHAARGRLPPQPPHPHPTSLRLSGDTGGPSTVVRRVGRRPQ